MRYKKTIMTAVLVLVISTSIPAFTWPLGVGVSSYYSYWKPAWSDSYSNVEIDPVFMVGPVVSITFFQDFTLTWLMTFNVHEPRVAYSVPIEGIGRVGVESRYTRNENELTFMYSISRYFRCFVGYKEQDYIENDTPERITVPSGYNNLITWWNHSLKLEGPGAGVSLVIPLESGLNITINTSVLYLYVKYDREELKIRSPNDIFTEPTGDRFKAVGNNSSIAFSYYISPINTAISFGGKFQFLRYYAEGDATALGNDYYYGATLAVLYFFH